MNPDSFKEIINSASTFSLLFLVVIGLYLNYLRLRRGKTSKR